MCCLSVMPASRKAAAARRKWDRSKWRPELVVEVISSSETQRILGDKIADYLSIGVDECWVVRPGDGTVEVLALTPGGAQSMAVYGQGAEVRSAVFTGLAVSVADVFAD